MFNEEDEMEKFHRDKAFFYIANIISCIRRKDDNGSLDYAKQLGLHLDDYRGSINERNMEIEA